MNRVTHSVRNRLSLRPPQAESLEILATLAEEIPLASPYSTYQVEIEFTHTAPPAGGGSSEHAYTFVA